MSVASASVVVSGTSRAWSRLAPLTGPGFVVFFVGGLVVSSPPSDSASDARWVSDYATHGKQLGHIATGVCLVLAGLCLVSFLTHLWTRIAAARQAASFSPLPVVAAGVAAACMGVGGVFMAATSAMVNGSAPMPSADFLRFGNDAGFILVSVPAMLATSLSIACLAVQAHAAGIFGARLLWFSALVAVVLLPSFLFFPIAALLIWLAVVSVALLRARPAR